MIQTRRLTRSEATGAIVFYFSSVTAAISAILLLLAAFWPSGAPGADFFAGQKFVAPERARIRPAGRRSACSAAPGRS